MKVPFVQGNLEVLDHVETEQEIVVPDSQSLRSNIDDEIIPETSSESDGNQSEDLFSEDEQIPSDNNDSVAEVSSQIEPNTEYSENFIIPESDDDENSSEYESIAAPVVSLNDSIPTMPNDYSVDSVYLSQMSSDNESVTGMNIFENTIVMETDSSESDAESIESHGIPLQFELNFVPDTDLSEDDESESSETDSPVEHEVTIPETSSENEEEDQVPMNSEDLFTPVHSPLMADTERSPDLFSEGSTHSTPEVDVNNQDEALHEVENTHESQNSPTVAEASMVTLVSPSLFGSNNISDVISPDLFDDESVEMNQDEHQDSEALPIIHENSEEIPGTPIANETGFPFVMPDIGSGK